MAVPPVSMDLFALATLPAAADEAGGPPSIKFYELRDNLGHAAPARQTVGPASGGVLVVVVGGVAGAMTSGSFCLPRPSLLVIFERFFTARPARPASAARPPALLPMPPPPELFPFEPPSRPARPARPVTEPELF